MALLSGLNKPVLRVFLQTEGWLLFFALFPAVIYSYTHSIWVGVNIFLGFALVITLALLWAFWGALFPKQADGS